MSCKPFRNLTVRTVGTLLAAHVPHFSDSKCAEGDFSVSKTNGTLELRQKMWSGGNHAPWSCPMRVTPAGFIHAQCCTPHILALRIRHNCSHLNATSTVVSPACVAASHCQSDTTTTAYHSPIATQSEHAQIHLQHTVLLWIKKLFFLEHIEAKL